MTLLKKKQEMVRAFVEEWPAVQRGMFADSVIAFADALLEEACKAVCHLCAVGTPFSHEEDLKLTTHNIGTVEDRDYRQCRASAIRSGKGK